MAGGEPTDAELSARAKAGDRAAVEMLVKRHTPGVVELARRTGYTGANMDDLIQEGLVGLAHAAVKWGPEKGSKFWTYAFIVCRNSIRTAAAKFKKDEWLHTETDRETSGLNLQMVAGRDGGKPDISGLLGQMTALERGLITLLWGLEGEPVGVSRAAKRFGLTVRQAQEIVQSAFLRLRKHQYEEGE